MPKNALIVVDMQNDFADPAGALYVKGAELLVGSINSAIKKAVKNEDAVVYTKDWHPARTAHFDAWPAHCVADTWGAQFEENLHNVAETSPACYAYDHSAIFCKGLGDADAFSGFDGVRATDLGYEGIVFGIGLKTYLRENEVQEVTVVGLALDYCVKATALDAAKAGFETTVPVFLTLPVNLKPDDGVKALQELRAAGVNCIGAAKAC